MSLSPMTDLLYSPVGGVRFVESLSCATRVQVRFPRSKTRRIRKKWAQREANWRLEPWPDVYRLADGTIIGHPVTIRRLQRLIREGTP